MKSLVYQINHIIHADYDAVHRYDLPQQQYARACCRVCRSHEEDSGHSICVRACVNEGNQAYTHACTPSILCVTPVRASEEPGYFLSLPSGEQRS